MNFIEVFGFIHVVFYTTLGMYFVARAAYFGFMKNESRVLKFDKN